MVGGLDERPPAARLSAAVSAEAARLPAPGERRRSTPVPQASWRELVRATGPKHEMTALYRNRPALTDGTYGRRDEYRR